MGGLALTLVAGAGCAVSSSDGPRTPTTDASPAADTTIEGTSSVDIVDGWACYSVATAQGAVELVAGPGGYTEGDGGYLLGLEPDGALDVGTTWVLSGEFVAPEEVEGERGACPAADRYFAIAGGEDAQA